MRPLETLPSSFLSGAEAEGVGSEQPAPGSRCGVPPPQPRGFRTCTRSRHQEGVCPQVEKQSEPSVKLEIPSNTVFPQFGVNRDARTKFGVLPVLFKDYITIAMAMIAHILKS